MESLDTTGVTFRQLASSATAIIFERSRDYLQLLPIISSLPSPLKLLGFGKWGSVWVADADKMRVLEDALKVMKESGRPLETIQLDCSISSHGPRHITTRLIQVITGHAFFGNYYKRFRPLDPTSCACDRHTLQTREHIICECPLYHHARHHLREVSPTLSLPIILGSKKGLAALAKFLAASSAFTKVPAPGVPVPHDTPNG